MSYTQVKSLIEGANDIVIVQADNPDADSLGSALALEGIIQDINKRPYLYCGVDIPSYLHYLTGWSRVEKELPQKFDLVIIVDASTNTLLEKITSDPRYSKFQTTPKIILDHHVATTDEIEGTTINDPKLSSTGELVFNLCSEVGFKINPDIGESILAAILGDTQGLSNDLATARTFATVAKLIDLEVDRMGLEKRRREFNKFIPDIFKYKAALINKTVLTDTGIAYVEVPQSEINQYSAKYNPAALIHPEMLQVEGIRLGVVFKHYDDGKITAAIRANVDSPIAGELALAFGGGGHKYASGFKITDGRTLSDVKSECLRTAAEMLEKVDED